jgi:hypothetical protein
MARGFDLCLMLLIPLGHDLARVAIAHESTLLATRTHGQQAIPTTFGAKVVIWLAELRCSFPDSGPHETGRPSFRTGQLRPARPRDRRVMRCATD